MCSILGYLNTKLKFEKVKELNNSMAHRGPDNSTVLEINSNTNNVFFCHNRLSIQDLTNNANQPMENEKFVIVFNGEIYNHLELRSECPFNWKTSSDTETLLILFSNFGIEKTISKLIGMFSIALYNKLDNKLILIRDRVGIKPLYYTFQNDEFVFSSELKGFSSHLKRCKNDKSLVQFMTLGYIPYDNTYYKEIKKLPAGHLLVFDGTKYDIKKYWNLPNNKINLDFDTAVNETEKLIRSSIKYRLLSDVEVGSFLSGGIDSSLVSTIMQQESKKKIKTFSIGFEDKKYDESIYARSVAEHIGSEHYEYSFTQKDVFELVDKMENYYDEPFGDSSSLPMMILSQISKKHVSVALSGDGGDELFLGYNRYFFTRDYYNKLQKLPYFLRNILSTICKYSYKDRLEKINYPINHLSVENLYSILYSAVKPWELNSLFDKEFLYESYGKSELSLLDILEYSFEGDTLIDNLSRLDFNRYLPDDILTKVDRASMAYSLEARVPLLDHRIVEFAYSLSPSIKLQNGPKSLLKEILYKYTPKELIERPKKGFSVPLKYWFRNELKDVLYTKINNLDNRLNKNYIKKIYSEHQKGKNFEYILWNIMRIK